MTTPTDGPGPELQPEPRRQVRKTVSLQGRALREDGTSVDISLLDLNYDGCGIETPVELGPGEKVRLSVVGRGLIDAEVRWCGDGKAGLRFAADEPEAETRTPRTADRANVSTEVRVRRIGQNNYSVRIFDLSPEGAKIEVVERPRVGEQLMVKFDGLEVLQADVCWVDEFVVGLKFERPLHPAVFDLLIARLQA